MASNLVSKLLAGGLSAGVFLLWWPERFPAEGLSWLVLRGVLWTMAFEILLLAFSPLEAMAWRRLRAPRLTAAAERVRAARAPVQVTGAVMLASAGVALPVALLAGAHGEGAATPVAHAT